MTVVRRRGPVSGDGCRVLGRLQLRHPALVLQTGDWSAVRISCHDAVLQMLEQVRAEHELDYIMITGDYPAHDVWLQSR